MIAQEQQAILNTLDEKWEKVKNEPEKTTLWAIYYGATDIAKTIFKENGKQLGRYKGKHYITSNSTEAKR